MPYSIRQTAARLSVRGRLIALGFSLRLSKTLLIEHFKVHFRQMHRRHIGAGHQISEVGAQIGSAGMP